MPNTFSMAPRYVRDFAARTAFSSPERDVFDCLERKLSRLYRQAAPQTPGLALLGDARDVGAAGEGRAPRAGPARPGPARRDLAALPPGRQVRLLQLAPDVAARLRRPRDRRHPRRRPSPRAVPRVPARRPGRPADRPSPTTRSSSSSSATSSSIGADRSPAPSGLPSASGRRPPPPRATAWRASPSTTSRPTGR